MSVFNIQGIKHCFLTKNGSFLGCFFVQKSHKIRGCKNLWFSNLHKFAHFVHRRSNFSKAEGYEERAKNLHIFLTPNFALSHPRRFSSKISLLKIALFDKQLQIKLCTNLHTKILLFQVPIRKLVSTLRIFDPRYGALSRGVKFYMIFLILYKSRQRDVSQHKKMGKIDKKKDPKLRRLRFIARRFFS